MALDLDAHVDLSTPLYDLDGNALGPPSTIAVAPSAVFGALVLGGGAFFGDGPASAFTRRVFIEASAGHPRWRVRGRIV